MAESKLTNIEVAILGLVAEGPRHGYQVEQDIQQRGMRAWTEIGFSSIYYILNKLEDAGWLLSERVSEGDRPARKVYQLTGVGRQSLEEAIRQRLESPRPRSGDFALALSNLAVLPPEEYIQLLRHYEQSLIRRLETVHEKWAEPRPQQLPLAVDALFSHTAHSIQAELDWLRLFLTQLEMN